MCREDRGGELSLKSDTVGDEDGKPVYEDCYVKEHCYVHEICCVKKTTGQDAMVEAAKILLTRRPV